MLTIAYSTREHKPEFIEYLKKSSGFKKIEVIEKVNNGEKSLAKLYNEILSEAKTDIIVFCHDDIYFDTTGWIILTNEENFLQDLYNELHKLNESYYMKYIDTVEKNYKTAVQCASKEKELIKIIKPFLS